MKLKNKAIIAISIFIFLLLFIQLIAQHPPRKNLTIDFNKLAEFATAIGGIFTFISVFLLYKTLRYQIKAAKHQSDSFNLTQFENRVFELIRYHRDNVSNIKMRAPDKVEEVYYDGHKALREIHKQMIKIVKSLEDFFQQPSLYKNEHNASALDAISTDRHIPINKLDLYNVSYLCLFFGMSVEGKKSLTKILSERYTEWVIDKIFNSLGEVIAVWQRNDSSRNYSINLELPKLIHDLGFKVNIESDKKNLALKTKYYGGHQYRLGHYFRHIYQIINYIDNNEQLTYQNKYEYVKILRAQLSTYEQTLIFFNSISNLGRVWELEVKKGSVPTDKIREYDIYKGLITKYNFIRNIPNEFITDISVSDIYPNLTFEGQEDNEQKKSNNIIYQKTLKYFS